MSAPTISELIDRAIRAYLQGRSGEALRGFQQVLDADPGNARARSYVILINGDAPSPGAGGSHPVPPDAAQTPAPQAAVPVSAPGTTPAPVSLPVPPRGVGAAARGAPGQDPSPWDEGPAAAATFVLDPTGGLDLVAVAEKSDLRPLVPEGPRLTPAPRNDVEVWIRAARELHALGDFSGSLELIEKILQVDPSHTEARQYLSQNEATLIAMYESKLGSLTSVPRLAIKPEEVMWLNLDHRAGFLLAQIDGMVDYEALFALSGLPRLDTARILATLIQDGVIAS